MHVSAAVQGSSGSKASEAPIRFHRSQSHAQDTTIVRKHKHVSRPASILSDAEYVYVCQLQRIRHATFQVQSGHLHNGRLYPKRQGTSAASPDGRAVAPRKKELCRLIAQVAMVVQVSNSRANRRRKWLSRRLESSLACQQWQHDEESLTACVSVVAENTTFDDPCQMSQTMSTYVPCNTCAAKREAKDREPYTCVYFRCSIGH